MALYSQDGLPILTMTDFEEDGAKYFRWSSPPVYTDRIKGFETRFIDLRMTALEEITEKETAEKGITVGDFRRSLMTLPTLIKYYFNYSLFEEAKSIESIFLHLNFYLSFIDFSLLEHIIEQFGSDSLKQNMSNYAEDMRQFRIKTPVSEALNYLPKISDTPVGYSRLTVMFDLDVQSVTLEDLQMCRKRFASEFLLSQLALSLSDLQESSLLVTWLVPAAVGAMISDQVQKKSFSFFLSNSIFKLSLEGECLYPIAKVSPVIEVEAGKPHQKIADEMKQTFKLGPNHHGLAIVVGSIFYLPKVLTRTFAAYEPPNKPSLKSHMQAVDLKYHPILVVVDGVGVGHLLRTCIGHIDIKEDIMAPLFPPIATRLADNPKIFLFVDQSGYSEHALHFIEAIWENYIVGYIASNSLSDMLRVTPIIQEELVSPSMSVQEIFTSISDKLPPTVTMAVIDRLKEPVYLHPRSILQELTMLLDTPPHLLKQSIVRLIARLSRLEKQSIDELNNCLTRADLWQQPTKDPRESRRLEKSTKKPKPEKG